MSTKVKEPELKPKITKEIITRFYVEIGDWIQAGPFDTREEAQAALEEVKRNQLKQ
jgi:SPOR domain